MIRTKISEATAAGKGSKQVHNTTFDQIGNGLGDLLWITKMTLKRLAA